MISDIFTTAVGVSIDSFFSGLSLPSEPKNFFKSIAAAVTAVFILCLSGAIAGKTAGKFSGGFADFAGGIALIIIAVTELSKRKMQNAFSAAKPCGIEKSAGVGLAVGLDGAVGAFTLTSSGVNAMLSVAVITFFHAVFMTAAASLASFAVKFRKAEKLPSAVLLILGAHKILGYLVG